MARFEPRQFTQFLERMINRAVARTELTDVEEGGNLHTIFAAVARELDDISYQMVNLQRIWDIDTATGEDLDARALDTNPDKLSRQGATKATSTVVFSRAGTSGLVNIPAGSIVRVPSGGPEYETTASGTINNAASSSASIPVLALVAGSDGNVDADTITQLDAITGVETVTNTTAATGGSDEETDAEFRERIKAYLRSLPRGTPQALKFAVLNTELEDYGRIVTAEVVELTGDDLGKSYVYVDDGTGTIVVTDNNTGSPETVIASALGGEDHLYLDNFPVREGATITIEVNGSPIVEGTDYTIDLSQGLIVFDITAYPTGLTATDEVTAEYTWYTGLIAEAQKIIEGDRNDRANYPGYKAAGTQVFVRSPTVLIQTISAAVTVEEGFDGDTVRDAVASALIRYINSLTINGDVYLSEMYFAAQSVRGVVDIIFSEPSGNVAIGTGELARTSSANVTII